MLSSIIWCLQASHAAVAAASVREVWSVYLCWRQLKWRGQRHWPGLHRPQCTTLPLSINANQEGLWFDSPTSMTWRVQMPRTVRDGTSAAATQRPSNLKVRSYCATELNWPGMDLLGSVYLHLNFAVHSKTKTKNAFISSFFTENGNKTKNGLTLKKLEHQWMIPYASSL